MVGPPTCFDIVECEARRCQAQPDLPRVTCVEMSSCPGAFPAVKLRMVPNRHTVTGGHRRTKNLET